MINCTILPSGELKVTADNEARAYIKDRLANGRVSHGAIMAELFESYSVNGSYEPFDASDGNPFVGLTDAPCIAECIDTLDNGSREIVGRFWYFANYAYTLELDELKNKGRVVYQYGGASEGEST